jgi:serine/threonine protein phosphatase PrpC
MSGNNADMILLDGAMAPQKRSDVVAGGSFVAYTGPSPDKETGNEDTVAVIPYGSDSVVLVVADGAGGLPAGQRASETAVKTLNESLQSSIADSTLLRTAILNGIDLANQSILGLGNGSATTMTVVAIEGITARSYQIGDSEAMIVGQRGVIRDHTMSHSPTGFLVEAGFLDEREALHHEERHLVSNFIGTSDMHIDIGAEIKLKPRDTILVASDGLTDNIHIEEIARMMRKGPLEKAVDSISNLATRRMTVESSTQPSKPDDLSIILFRKPYKIDA